MFQLSPIPLAALRGKTKDYILGRASYLKCSPEQVIVELLDGAREPQARTVHPQSEAQATSAMAA